MLLEWVLTSMFLILTVLALRAAFGRRVSARLRYALWAVVLVRLLVPVQLFTSPLAGTRFFSESRTEQTVTEWPITSDAHVTAGPDDGVSLSLPDKTVTNFPAAPQAPEPPTVPVAPEAPDWTKVPVYLGWVWLGGSVALALVLAASNLRFALRLRRSCIPMKWADCPLPVYAAVGLPSPCLFGLIRPAVYVTPEAATDPARLRHVIAHEYTHFRQGDHLWSFLRCAALAAHWWNPLVWLAVKLSRRDGELACDEGALKRLGDGERLAYGNTLLALVTAKPGPGDLLCFATTMAGEKKSLKERISRIACAPRRWLWAAVAVVLATALACACAFGSAEDPNTADGPDAEPTSSAGQSGHYVAQENTGEIPAQVQADAEEFVQGRFEDLRDRRISYAIDGTAAYIADEIDLPELDDWRIESLTGPYWSGEVYWDMLGVDRRVELWHVVYGYHSPTPDKAWNLANGATDLTEDGWLTPINYGAEYLIYELGEDGGRTLLTVSGLQTDVMSVMFRRDLRAALAKDSMADTDFVLEDVEFQLDREVDLDRDGVPEYMQIVETGNGQQVELWEGDKLLWLGYAANFHAGETSFLLYSVDGEDYLMEFEIHGGMGRAHGDYRIFTLENGAETTVWENHVTFDYCTDSIASVKDNFDPEAVAAFVDEADRLLEHCFLLADTGGNYRGDPPTYVQIDLRWLDTYATGFTWDDSRTTLENLKQFKLMAEYPRYAGDLNGDTRTEEILVSELDDGAGLRVELWDNGKTIWSDEGYYAHAGYNAVFLCTLNGKDYLLRYHPYMGQGWCDYSYELFTLTQDGKEKVVRENSVEFDINFGPMHESFDPEAIAAFMDEINGLLANSVQLINTDADLLRTFQKEGRLYDSLGWLDLWAPFARDGTASLLETLRAFQGYMEAVNTSYQSILLGKSKFVLYQDEQTSSFVSIDDVPALIYEDDPYVKIWDFAVVDMDGDGTDEVLVWVCGVTTDFSGYLLLREENGTFYGTIFNAHNNWSNRWFGDLKTDGTFDCNDVVDRWHNISKLYFTPRGGAGIYGLTVIRNDPDYDLESFMEIQKEVTREKDWWAAKETQKGKPDAVWYEFNEENIADVFMKG